MCILRKIINWKWCKIIRRNFRGDFIGIENDTRDYSSSTYATLWLHVKKSPVNPTGSNQIAVLKQNSTWLADVDPKIIGPDCYWYRLISAWTSVCRQLVEREKKFRGELIYIETLTFRSVLSTIIFEFGTQNFCN